MPGIRQAGRARFGKIRRTRAGRAHHARGSIRRGWNGSVISEADALNGCLSGAIEAIHGSHAPLSGRPCWHPRRLALVSGRRETKLLASERACAEDGSSLASGSVTLGIVSRRLADLDGASGVFETAPGDHGARRDAMVAVVQGGDAALDAGMAMIVGRAR